MWVRKSLHVGKLAMYLSYLHICKSDKLVLNFAWKFNEPKIIKSIEKQVSQLPVEKATKSQSRSCTAVRMDVWLKS